MVAWQAVREGAFLFYSFVSLMSSQRNNASNFLLIAAPVVLVIAGAFLIAVQSAFENLRFMRATGQISLFVNTARSVAVDQKNLIFTPGEDVWMDMIKTGQIASSTDHNNPWGGAIRATAVDNNSMRVESDLPVHECRRIMLYFMEHNPVEQGLLAVEAQQEGDVVWGHVYPAVSDKATLAPEEACGRSKKSTLAMIFRLR